MRRSCVRTPAGAAAGGVLGAASASVGDQRRELLPVFRSSKPFRFNIQYSTQFDKQYYDNLSKNWKRDPKWDYNKVDEHITKNSELSSFHNRPDFDGPRPATDMWEPSPLYKSHSKRHKFKMLWEHFDRYTQPGSDPKIEAVKAAREHYDADELYYPGETWKRNRPGFRSVPQDLVNKQSIHHWTEFFTRWEELETCNRSRTFNPMWPPPGYKTPKLWTKRVFGFGADEPGLVMECERWFWYRSWFENNFRNGPTEIMFWLLFMYAWWSLCRGHHECQLPGMQMNNMWYPGRTAVRGHHEAKNPVVDGYWWQGPLETFPNQGEVWYYRESRFGYAIYQKKKLAREKAEAEGRAVEEPKKEQERFMGIEMPSKGYFQPCAFGIFPNPVGIPCFMGPYFTFPKKGLNLERTAEVHLNQNFV